MSPKEAVAFVRRSGVVLQAGRGPVPNLAEAIAEEPIRGSWWSHPLSHHMFRVFEAVRDSNQILVCRLVGGKVTFVHRRLWPALVRLSGRLPKRGLSAVREEHTARGHHKTTATPFPRWVPESVLDQGRKLEESEAIALLGEEIFGIISARRKVRVRPAAPGA